MSRQQEPIPFGPPSVGDAEKEALAAVIDSRWLSRGPKCGEFEAAFGQYTGAAHAVSLSSCTAALHLALVAFDIGPGDEVITTPLTFPATVNAILYVGATPVLVDVGEDYNLDPAAVARALGPRTKAVIGVDMHGLPCRRPPLPPGVRFIRDAAHSLGARVDADTRVGADADATCFSFYATKQITTGDGGMLTTGAEPVAERVRRLSLHGMDVNAWKRYGPDYRGGWDVPEIGYKYNLTDLQAAIGLEQLKKLPLFLRQRRQLADRYHRLLQPLAAAGKLTLPPAKEVWHLYAVRVPEREWVQARLREAGIATGIHFRPVNTLTAYQALNRGEFPERLTPTATQIGATTLSLPFFVGMTEAQQRRVGEALQEAVL